MSPNRGHHEWCGVRCGKVTKMGVPGIRRHQGWNCTKPLRDPRGAAVGSISQAVSAYQAKPYNSSGLTGISDQTLEMHLKLYEGYVRETNRLTEHIARFLKDGTVDQEDMTAYSELTRRLGFEYNGMVLHEYYFDNLKRRGSGDPGRASVFVKDAESSFGSSAGWKSDFSSIAKMRGVGWAICYRNPMNGRLSNHWITMHETGNVAGFTPLLVLDVWEHAFLLDYKPSERGKYIEALFSNINWDVVEKRLRASAN